MKTVIIQQMFMMRMETKQKILGQEMLHSAIAGNIQIRNQDLYTSGIDIMTQVQVHL